MPRGGARTRKSFVNRNRTCDCGRCTLCKIRAWKHLYYLEHRQETKARTRQNYLNRKASKPLEPTDAELDAKALEWLEKNQVNSTDSRTFPYCPKDRFVR